MTLHQPAPDTTGPRTSKLDDTIGDLATFIASRRGAQRVALSVVFGLCAALALAPIHLTFLLFLALSGLVLQLDGLGGRKRLATAALIGWSFGLGFFSLGIYWLANAFLVDAEAFGALMPIAMLVTCTGFALFPAVTTLIARIFWSSSPSRTVVLALAFCATEWVRGHLFTGFPWNFAGHSWGWALPVQQMVSLFGVYGLSLLTLCIVAAPAALIRMRDGGFHFALRPIPLLPGTIALAFLLLTIFGFFRLTEAPSAAVNGVHLRLVQPSVPQAEKIAPGTAQDIFERHLALTRRPGLERITHVVWPEAAVPVLIDEAPGYLGAIADLLADDQTLVVGAARAERRAGGRAERFFNSLHVIDDEGRILLTYDKSHLVPFGEFLPLQPVLAAIGLRQLVESGSGFTAGPGRRTLDVPHAPPVGPLICYEAVYPGEVTERGKRPAWLLNITDDTWFGNGSGPRQHFESARLRAIEEGLPLVRAANSGISAVFDPRGRLLTRLGLNEIGVIDTDLPSAATQTVYSRYGGLAFLALYLAVSMGVVLARWTSRPR